MKSPLYLIIRREYLERVSKKSFIITTLLMPVFLVAMMVIPSLVMIFAGTESKTIAVVDQSNVIAQSLKSDDDLKFEIIPDANMSIDSVRNNDAFDGLLIIDDDIVDYPDHIHLYTKGAPSMQTEMFISNQVADAVSDTRLKKYDIDNLKTIIADIDVDVDIQTYRIDKEETESTSSMVSYMLGLGVAFILYMFLLIYGQMVMTSIIEEKNNRVLEIVVSSVKPQILMLGKIMGIAAVAITQILIWGVIVASVSMWVLPLINAGISASDPELASIMDVIGNPAYIASLFGYITLFMVFGFTFYAAIFAAIGSAVDNINDASQLTTIATMPVIFGLIFSMVALNDPNSTLAVWLSMIPFTSPMVMMSRIAFGIPSWQIWVSLVILIVSVFGIVWLAAKIYRVGIFMYGKKPKLTDLLKWARYK